MAGPPHPRRTLDAYVDDRLAPWRRSLLERHLGRCTRCALEVARSRQLRRRLASPPPQAPSPELLARLLDIGREAEGPAPDLGPSSARPRGPATARPPWSAPPGCWSRGCWSWVRRGAGAVVTGGMAPGAGPGARASLTTVLPRLLSWPSGGDGAATVRPVDNGARP